MMQTLMSSKIESPDNFENVTQAPGLCVGGYQSLDDAFPNVDPMVKPLGNRILVQIRTPKNKTKGGIILTEDVQEDELWNEMTAKVIALGPLAFHNRETLKPWPEGEWCKVGDFVRVPKWGGDRIMRGKIGDSNFALFVIFNDHEVIAQVTGDPLELKTYY